MLAMAEDMLAQLGYEPVGYDNSVKALEAFRAGPERFDAMLTDELMPELTGTQLAVRVKELRPELPVRDRERLWRAGVAAARTGRRSISGGRQAV